MFPHLSRISSSHGLPVPNPNVKSTFLQVLWSEQDRESTPPKLYLHTDVVRKSICHKNCKLSPPFTRLSCLIRSLRLVFPGFSRQREKKKVILHFWQQQQHNRLWCLRRFLSPPLPVTLTKYSRTWGTATIKSTNRQMPGCSAQSAPAWQSVLLVITASWFGSLKIHLPSAGSCSNFATVAALFT